MTTNPQYTAAMLPACEAALDKLAQIEQAVLQRGPWEVRLGDDGSTLDAAILIRGTERYSGYIVECQALNNEGALGFIAAARNFTPAAIAIMRQTCTALREAEAEIQWWRDRGYSDESIERNDQSAAEWGDLRTLRAQVAYMHSALAEQGLVEVTE